MRTGPAVARLALIAGLAFTATALADTAPQGPSGSLVSPVPGTSQVVSTTGTSGVFVEWNASCPNTDAPNPAYHYWYVQIEILHEDGSRANSDSTAYHGVTDSAGNNTQGLIVQMAKGRETETFQVKVSLTCDGQQTVIGSDSITLCRGSTTANADGEKYIKLKEGDCKKVGKKVKGKKQKTVCGQAALDEYDQDGSEKGNCTIGWGHLIHTGKCVCTHSGKPCADKAEKPFYKGISEAEAQKLLDKDISDAQEDVNRNAKLPLSQCQMNGLTDFFFNLGSHGLHKKVGKKYTSAPSQVVVDLRDGAYTSLVPDILKYGRSGTSLHERRIHDAQQVDNGTCTCPPA